MRLSFAALNLLVLVAAGCGSAGAADNAATATSTTAAATEAVATTTSTAPASTMSIEVPSVSLPKPGEPWDLLYIADSGGWGVAPLLAERAAVELGVEVRVHDETEGGLAAAVVLQRMRDEVYPGISHLVRDAEIIVVYGNWVGSGVAEDINTCVSTSTAVRQPPVVDTRSDWQPYREVLDDIYEAIWDLREGTPTVLRAIDMYNPAISDWRAAGIEPECTAEWETWSSVIREAAVDNNAVMVSVYDTFNGPDHQQDPRERGYILPDGEHTTPEGAAVIADAIAAVGFEPTARR